MPAPRHKWTKEDDILVFYLYRYGNTDFSRKQVAKCIDVSTGSLAWRLGNFEYAYTGTGRANHCAKLTEKVCAEWGGVSQEEHRRKCLEILKNAKNLII